MLRSGVSKLKATWLEERGRILKVLLDGSDRNGSTSRSSPWLLDNDDDDDDDDNDSDEDDDYDSNGDDENSWNM
jgi:hypothetical protein